MTVIPMRIEELLEARIHALTPSRVRDAMEYSLMAGGKRIRPQLLYEVVKGYGLAETDADEFACALEMIHTYSLIHDDLPAMDNDTLRRGKPTCHVRFDEATAILAGDGLLTYAFEAAAASKLPAERVQKCIAILARMAGPDGMVLGQCYDMQEAVGATDWNALKEVHHYKTGCLLSAPLMMGAVIAGREEDTMQSWQQTGMELGLAFQVQDDLMDVTKTAEQLGKSNSDARNQKVTSVTLLGVGEARNLMESLYEDCIRRIGSERGFESNALAEMIEQIRTRQK